MAYKIEESNDSLGLQLVRTWGSNFIEERVFALEEDKGYSLWRYDYSDSNSNFGFPTIEPLERPYARNERDALQAMRHHLRACQSRL